MAGCVICFGSQENSNPSPKPRRSPTNSSIAITFDSPVIAQSNAHRLMVTHLPVNVTPGYLMDLFRKYGELKSHPNLVRNRSQKPMYCFVEYYDADSVFRACDLDGFSIEGRTLKVFPCEPRHPSHRNSQLYLKEIPDEWCVHDLVTFAASYGDLRCAKVLLDPETGLSKSCGFIRYRTKDMALLALERIDHDKDGGPTMIAEAAKITSSHHHLSGSSSHDHGLSGNSGQRTFSSSGYNSPDSASTSGHGSSSNSSLSPILISGQSSTSSAGHGSSNSASTSGHDGSTVIQPSASVSDNEKSWLLLVDNIPIHFNDDSLATLFRCYGDVENAKIKRRGTIRGGGKAVVFMKSGEDAINAVSYLNNYPVGPGICLEVYL